MSKRAFKQVLNPRGLARLERSRKMGPLNVISRSDRKNSYFDEPLMISAFIMVSYKIIDEHNGSGHITALKLQVRSIRRHWAYGNQGAV